MKRKIKNIWKKVKSWNDYWTFIEQERMKAAKYTCSSGPLL
jgi:hypothetical protein|tara:strand:- start:36 stop:158 length:123 start_codon:yes stop_codon:yes gene_type:complete